MSEVSTYPDTKKPSPIFWSYWTYDQAGKLVDYRRGKDEELQNHDTNFKRDRQGRLVSFEYRQGAKDELLDRTEFRYSSDGRTIDLILYDKYGAEIRSTTEIQDDQGRVISAVLRRQDWKTKKPKAPIKVTFRYDAKGRLLEQDTAPYDVEKSGGEFELPPGKVLVTYDDAKNTKTTSAAGEEGALALTVTYSEKHEMIAIAGGSDESKVNLRLECTYDAHENWTACRLLSDGAVTKIWRRSIVYR